MKFLLSCFLLILFFSTHALSQNKEADSLINLLEKNKRKNTDSILFWGNKLLELSAANKNKNYAYEANRRISYYYLQNQVYDSVFVYDRRMLQNAKQLDSFKVISAYQNKAAYFDSKAEFDSSLIVLEKAQKLGYRNLKSADRTDSIKKIKSILFIETALVKNHLRNNNYEKALKLTYANLKTSNLYNIETFHAWNYFYLGLINLELGNLGEAEKYYLKELEFAKEKQNINMEGFALIHLGNVSIAKDNSEQEALKYYKQANSLFKQNNYSKGLMSAQRRLFEVYEKLNNYKSAIYIGENYVETYLKNKSQDGYLSAFLIALGRVHMKNGNEIKGNEYLRKGLSFVKENPNKENIDIINQAYKTYKSNKNYEKALEAFEYITHLKDSLLINEEFTSQLAEANTKYEVEQKNNKILTQKLEIEEKETEKQQAVYITSLFILLAFILSYLLYKRKKLLREEQSKYLQELKRGSQLEKMIARIQNQNYMVDGIDDTNFHDYIKDKLNINQELFDVYLLLLKEKTYNEIANTLNLSVNGIKSRIKKLHQSLKIYANRDIDMAIKKVDRIEIFNDLRIDFITNT
jgi:tetratricopeptide (TPR) repeat protein